MKRKALSSKVRRVVRFNKTVVLHKMANVNYTGPDAERRNIAERTKRTIELRNIFLKERSDPRRYAKMDSGFIFDAGLQRYTAMSVNMYESFKPSYKTIKFGLFMLVLPMVSTMYYMKYTRDAAENKFRTGQVAYKDRAFKFC